MKDLSKQQKEILKKIGKHYERLEKKAEANNIELDVFMNEYNENGFSFYTTEHVNLQNKPRNRKEIFMKAGKTKADKTTSSKLR